MEISSLTLADISQRYYDMADQIEPSALPKPGSVAVQSAPEAGRGTLVDTYV